MKRIIGIFWVVTLLGSCTSYYYSKISSNDTTGIKDENGYFVTGNDSILIVYSFAGEDAPVTITVVNHTNQPVYVDWQKSALIINDEAVNYKAEKITTETNYQSMTYKGNYIDYTTGKERTTTTYPRDMSFIPPYSRNSHTPLRLSDFPFDTIPQRHYRTTKFAKSNNEIVTVKTVGYAEPESPLRMRSYLTLYIPDGDRDIIMVSEQTFYLSQLIKTGNIAPSNFADNNRGDFFYVRKEKGTGAKIFFTAVAIGAVDGAIEGVIEGATQRLYNK